MPDDGQGLVTVIELAVAQLRFAGSMLFGLPFHGPSLERLIGAIQDTQREFGRVGSGYGELMGEPALDEAARRDVQWRRFRAQAVRAARETAYYREMFVHLGLDPTHLRPEDISALPTTPKEALRDHPDAFVRPAARPCLQATTTGTTGRPTSVCFSEYELRTMVALATMALLARQEVGPEDIVLVSTSSRGTLGTLSFAGACVRVGALVNVVAVAEPAHTLALLAEPRQVAGKKPRVSALSAYPSYLGELTQRGLEMGYRPEDFGLERILVGGEIVTAGLKARCQRLFGPVSFVEGYAMSETFPCGGQLCPDGHLHFEVSQGLVEVQAIGASAPALPGAPGTLLATPFLPYRETTMLLRYDTQDVVRALPTPPTCNLASLPATSNVLGKLRLSLQHDGGWTFPRQVLEALEATAEVPLPARWGYRSVPGGVAVEVVTPADTPAVRAAIGERLEEEGVPLRELELVGDRNCLRHPFPLRGDIREAAFGPPSSAEVTR